MPKQTIQLDALTGGVNRAQAREKQPAGTVYDAVNMQPFDRSGRLRVGQRAGTAALLSSISSGNVNGLIQVTLGQEEIEGTAGPASYGQDWVAVDGTQLDPSIWEARRLATSSDDPAASSDGTLDWSDATALEVASNMLKVNPLGQANRQGAFLQSTLSTTPLPNSYAVSLSAAVGGTGGAGNKYIEIWTRAKVPVFPATDTQGIICRVNLNNIQIIRMNANATFTTLATANFNVALSNNETVIVNLTVIGNSFDFQVENNTATKTAGLTTTVTDFTTNKALGIVMDHYEASRYGFDSFEFDNNDPPPEVTSNPRTIKVIAAAAGEIYWGTPSGMTQKATGLKSRRPCLTDVGGNVFYVNGTETKVIAASTGTVTDPVASAGTFPTLCRGCRTWRGRLVLFAQTADPQNFFMSRSGDAFDFDFSQGDPAAAFAGNASDAGRVGDLIVDMIAWNADKLVIGCDHSLWLIEGDPADGGSIICISNAIGLLGMNAWSIAPNGVLYFAGSNGLYRMTPGAETPEPVSLDKYPQFFSALNRGGNYYSMVWDRDRHGCYLFATAVTSGTSTHLWYDLRSDGLWPIQYPDNHGPMSVLVYDGDGEQDRFMMLGGRDGVIRNIVPTALTDSGTAIAAYLVAGPLQPFPGDAAVLTGSTIDFGELASADMATPSRWGVQVTLRGGTNAYDVTEGTPHSKAVIDIGDLDRRSKTFRQRIRGGWFAVKFANSTSSNYFSIESGVLEFEPAGKLRERR